MNRKEILNTSTYEAPENLDLRGEREARVQLMRWRPIETAPYDQHAVLVGGNYGGYAYPIMRASAEEGYDWFGYDVLVGWIKAHPDVWMPLPAAPKCPEEI